MSTVRDCTCGLPANPQRKAALASGAVSPPLWGLSKNARAALEGSMNRAPKEYSICISLFWPESVLKPGVSGLI